MKEFYETRKLYRDYTHYEKPLTFDQWSTLDHGYKAAVLFIQFFDEILLAWNKAKSYDGDELEAVETVNQYLVKNVDKIMEEPKRFKAAYIYRVAYNALYCICHDRVSDKDRREREVDPYVDKGDGTYLNITDFIPSSKAQHDLDEVEDDMLAKSKEFWDLVESVDKDADVIIKYIIGSRKDLTKRASRKKDAVLEKMRELLVQRPDLVECFMK